MQYIFKIQNYMMKEERNKILVSNERFSGIYFLLIADYFYSFHAKVLHKIIYRIGTHASITSANFLRSKSRRNHEEN